MKIIESAASFIIFNLIYFSSVECNDFKLELVQVVFRHGDRVAQEEEIYKTDPYKAIFEAEGYGQLTKTGMQREHKIGRMLRERYENFLGNPDPNQVYAFSTDFDRTKMSLQLVLSGLYPPTNKTIWNKDIPWIPIPTHYKENDDNFLSTFVCPTFLELVNQVESSPELQEKLRKYDDFIRYLKNKTEVTNVSPYSIFLIYNNIHSALSMGLPLPYWCSEEDYKNLKEISIIAYDAMVLTERMKRIVVGPTIEQFIKNIDDNNNNKNGKKIYLYGAHDFNIATFTRAHNFTNNPIKLPAYGSALMFEKLRGKDNGIYVRMAVWTGAGDSQTPPQIIPLKLENCENECLLSDYIQIVKSILPDDESRRCLSSYTCERQRS